MDIMPLCELCGREQAEYLAEEQRPPKRKVLIGRKCLEQTKDVYKEPRWKISELKH